MNTANSANQPNDTLRDFLQEEIDNIQERLESLKGSLRPDDFNSLQAELIERKETLDSLQDEDDTQLFILRRHLGLLRENMELLAVKQSWWSRLPVYARVLLITIPVILYLLVLSLIQWANKGAIYDYPATQTAFATQTMQAAQATLPGTSGPTTPTPKPAP